MKLFFTAAALAVSGSAFVAADNEQFSGHAESHVRGGHSAVSRKEHSVDLWMKDTTRLRLHLY